MTLDTIPSQTKGADVDNKLAKPSDTRKLDDLLSEAREANAAEKDMEAQGKEAQHKLTTAKFDSQYTLCKVYHHVLENGLENDVARKFEDLNFDNNNRRKDPQLPYMLASLVIEDKNDTKRRADASNFIENFRSVYPEVLDGPYPDLETFIKSVKEAGGFAKLRKNPEQFQKEHNGYADLEEAIEDSKLKQVGEMKETKSLSACDSRIFVGIRGDDGDPARLFVTKEGEKSDLARPVRILERFFKAQAEK